MTDEERRLVAEMRAKLGQVLDRMNPASNLLRGPTPEAPKRRVTPEDIFPNCPRNIPLHQVVEVSPYVPRCGVDRVEPAWKTFEIFADVVPPRHA